tara:strand:+ start:189 stop:305 length:117 start_codon:yes stop_codon:yes gene_type:complete
MKVYFDPMAEIEQDREQRTVIQYIKFLTLITQLIRRLK